MNSNAGVAMVKKRQKQDYLSQQGIFITLPSYVSPLLISTYVGK